MSTSAPIPLIQNGLVFSYDTYNSKSYRGEPTTNLVTNADTMASWSAYDNGNDGTFITEFGTTGYRMINRGSWNGIYRGITLNSTGNHTFSAYIRYWGGASNNNGGAVYTGGFGVSDSASYVNKNLIGVWQRITLTINATTTSGTLYLISYGGTNGGDKSTWEVTMPQVEKNTHATQFVNGTRSTTDGLVDLTRTNTINLSSAGYDSGANITLNGQWIDCSGITKATTCTFVSWAKTTTLASNPMLFNAGLYGAGPDLFFYNNKISWNVWDGDSNPLCTTPASVTDGNYHLYVLVNDASSDAKLYYDGNLIGTAIHRSAAGNTRLIVGGEPAGYYWNGSIPVFSVYNRALAASEVLQLYNSTKSRFGL